MSADSSSAAVAHPFDPGCIFCRIIKGEIPCFRVYEDDEFFGFLDISPVTPGHVLLLPKGHYPSVLDMPESVGTALLRGIARLGNATMQTMNAQGFNLLQNTHEAAGQTVFHAHWHIIPRVHGDGFTPWPQQENPGKERMQSIADAIHALSVSD
ncbi:HIT family protein [Desulfovibrio sp. OttesenSCG-928-I05]|nr:HIT family protein [Desulfovibrio sp. OttesenSCG-928-I05]